MDDSNILTKQDVIIDDSDILTMQGVIDAYKKLKKKSFANKLVSSILKLFKALQSEKKQTSFVGKFTTYFRHSPKERVFVFDEDFNAFYGHKNIQEMLKPSKNPVQKFMTYKHEISELVLCACHKNLYISNDADFQIEIDDELLDRTDKLQNLENMSNYEFRPRDRGDNCLKWFYKCKYYGMQISNWMDGQLW